MTRPLSASSGHDLRFVIVGAGAVGSSVAAELHRAGIETVLVARGAQLTALRDKGLHYVRPDAEHQLHIPVAGGPSEVDLRESDVLILATKTQDTAAAVDEWAWRPVKRADGSTGAAASDLPVITLQNGLANEDLALRAFATVIGGVIWIPATYLEAGEVVNRGIPQPAVLWLGRYPASGDTAVVDRIVTVIGRSDLGAHAVPDVVAHKAAKLLGNLVNGLDALYPPSQLRSTVLAALQAEARTVFTAAGIQPADLSSRAAGFGAGEVGGKKHGGNSTWQSLARGTSTEIDYLNGEVVLLARRHGTPAPLNTAVQARLHRATTEGAAPGSLTDADLAATLGWASSSKPQHEGVLITAAELHARGAQDDVPPVVLDVRWALGDPHGADHYRDGHIPGAVYVDLDTELAGAHEPGAGRHPLPAIADLQAAARRWGVNRTRGVVVYDNSGGLAAARAWWLLRWAGVPGVRILDGGLAAWADAGYDQISGEARPQRASDIVLTPGNMPTLTADEAAALPGRGGTLLDARAGERYRGEVEPIDPRAGHIPGAVSAPTADNLTAGVPHFKSRDELRERFRDVTGPVGVYCGSGVTASHEIAALAIAGIDAALYPGSWSAWSSDPDRPAATGAQP